MKLKRVYYSEVFLEEKDFGIQETILRAKRKGQVAIGKVRTQMANKLMESARKDQKLNQKAVSLVKKYDDRVNPAHSISENRNITKGLFRECKSNGGRVFPGSTSSFLPKTKDMVDIASGILNATGETKNSISSFDRSIANHVMKPSTTSIVTLGNNNISTLAHEIGHQSRYVSNNPISRHSIKTAESFNDWIKKSPKNQSIKENGILDMAVKSGSRLLEERGASKKGLDLLKKSGASDDQLLRSKRLLGVAGSTYNYAAKSSMKGLLSDFVQIPSRQRSSIIERNKNKINKSNNLKSIPNSKPATVRELKTTPKKPFGTKPITPMQKPFQSKPQTLGNVKY